MRNTLAEVYDDRAADAFSPGSQGRCAQVSMSQWTRPDKVPRFLSTRGASPSACCLWVQPDIKKCCDSDDEILTRAILAPVFPGDVRHITSRVFIILLAEGRTTSVGNG